MEITKEKSEEQAIILRRITQDALALDIDYLEEALKKMQDAHSFRESAAVLNPNPHTHNEKQRLNALKLEQLENFLSIARNVQKIIDAEINLGTAKKNVNVLEKLF